MATVAEIDSLSEKLMWACTRGESGTVQELLSRGASPSYRPWWGMTPLHAASGEGHLDVVKLLISDGRCDASSRNTYYGNTPLHEACKAGDLDIVKLLISDGHCNVNSRNKDGDTPLHVACRAGHLSIVKYLIVERGSNVNISNHLGQTPLHMACWEGHLSIVKYLIVEGHCDVHNSGQIPLHVACWKGDLDFVKLLISDERCDVNSRNKNGDTPLRKACRFNHLDTVKYLIVEGHCDVNIPNNSGQTPLHVVCRFNHLDTVKYLIVEGHCDVNIPNNSGQTPLHVVCRKGHLDLVKLLISVGHCNVNSGNKDGDTPLHEACRNGHLDVVKLLISDGRCDVSSRDSDGDTPLHKACRYGHLSTVKYLIVEGHCDVNILKNFTLMPLACRAGDLDIVKLLISEGHCHVNSRNKDGDTLLHEACSWSHLSIVKYLIVEGHCDVTILNNSGLTPLHVACGKGHLDVVKFLICDGHCNVNSGNKDGNTPLHVACSYSHLSTVKYLIMEGHCDVNISNIVGQTPLHVACRKDHLDVVKLLIFDGHSDINRQDKTEDTPLHEACRYSHLSTVKYLIVEGHCDVHISNISGQTPLHVACTYDRLDVVELLISAGHCGVNSKDKTGGTPLHGACSYGRLKTVKYLIVKGHCDVNISNNSGETLLHVACRYNRAQIVHYLLSETKYIVNKDDKTLLNLTDDPSTIRELLWYGVNPESVYAEYSSHLPEHAPKQPPQSAVKLFAVGDHGAGKSTLVKSLKKEGSGFSRVAGRVKKVTGVDEKTAGIIPHKLQSRFFGHVTLYDFAGHKEFYASHAAMIQQSMAGSSTAIFLLLADLRSDNEEFEGSILSWLSFIDNQCPLDPKPHIIIVGSHADKIELKGENGIAKSSIVDTLEFRDAFKHFEFRGFIAINCCYSQSSSISELRKKLAKSCETLRLKSELSFNTHCFLIYLLDKFRDYEAVKLKDVLSKVSKNTVLAESDHRKLLSFIPTDAPRLWEMCEDLHDRGSILLLRNTEKCEKSWLILDQATLLKTVPGKVFAPKGFKEHQDLASATGVVPFLKFRDHFPTLDPDMVAQFLCHLEFCQEVTDDEVLRLLQVPLSISCNERVFFFPSLVSIDAPELSQDSAAQIPAHASPTQVWKPNSNYVYSSGWILQCSQAEHHFTPRFLQVLLLRLAFCFALAPHVKKNKSDLQEITREFYVWKSGLCWVTRKGVAALVQMDKSGKTVTVLLRCLEYSKLQCIHLRSGIIHKVLCAREEFCPKVFTSEYFIHPDAIEYPLKPTIQLNLFSISQVTEAIAAGDSCVIGTDSQPLHLETLLYFEPYFHLNKTVVLDLFDEQKASHDVDGELMDQMAKCFCNKWDDIFNILKLSDSIVMKQASQNPDQAIVRLLQLWCLQSRKGSYQCLHRKLDQFSVFAGRHPFSPTTSTLSAQSTAETASEVDPTTDNYSTLIDSVDEATLDTVSLLEVKAELREAGPAWFDLGLALGLLQHTLESMQNQDDLGHCLTETLAAWLQGRDGAAAPTWRAVVKALLSPAMNFYRLARQISKAHQCDASSFLMTASEDPALEDVDKATLDVSSLIEVKSELLAGGRHLAWFELGLALGLYYGTLKVIQSEYSKDDEYLRDTLAAWLEQKDRVPQQGVPSWHSLTRALAHPLVSQQGLAQEIARKHPKVNKREEKRSDTEEGDTDSNQETANGHSDTDFQVNKSEEEKSDLDNSQVLLDELSSHSGTSQGDEDGCFSKCFRGSSDPVAVDVPNQLERMSEDEDSICSLTDVIHGLPEEMVNTTTKIPVLFSSAASIHTLSKHTVIATSIRNQQSLTTSSLSAQSTTETASEVDSTTDNYSILIDSVDETTLDITALHAVNSELVSVAPKWMELGLSLGLEQPVLDALESNYPRDVNRCLTETLARWLQQVRTARSWRAITHALIVPSINRVDLAHSIAMSHGIGTPKETDSRYQDVNSERLGISNLREVSEEICTVYEWLYLGLALGLSYDTLRTIEIECHQDISYCRTEMLKAWLKGMGGESSWRQLARALVSPLIRRPEIAAMIATEHTL